MSMDRRSFAFLLILTALVISPLGGCSFGCRMDVRIDVGMDDVDGVRERVVTIVADRLGMVEIQVSSVSRDEWRNFEHRGLDHFSFGISLEQTDPLVVSVIRYGKKTLTSDEIALYRDLVEELDTEFGATRVHADPMTSCGQQVLSTVSR
jgi:hypothetical protein